MIGRAKRINFQSSRLFWNHGTDESHGAFKIESVLRFYNEDGKLKDTFVLAVGVLAGNMYASERLVKEPPYLFQIVASDSQHIIYQ